MLGSFSRSSITDISRVITPKDFQVLMLGGYNKIDRLGRVNRAHYNIGVSCISSQHWLLNGGLGLLTSTPLHDSQGAIPLALMTASRVTN